MQNEFEKYIQSYFGLPQHTVDTILPFFKSQEYKKGDYFLKEGRYADKLGFVQSGIMREYLTDATGQEVTKWISTPGYFIVDIASFLFDQPARWNLQALTDCTLLVITKSDYVRIGQFVAKWPELEKLFIARCFTILEQRIVMHLSLSSEQRYAAFFCAKQRFIQPGPAAIPGFYARHDPGNVQPDQKKTVPEIFLIFVKSDRCEPPDLCPII